MKRLLCTLGLCCIIFQLFPQQASFKEKVAQHFARIWHHNPQEKIYLHTDKLAYSAGEIIWLKAYLINATTHQPSTKSNYVYVELLDSITRVTHRVKLRRTGAGAYGSISLANDVKPGEYTLRAYTYWMQNAGTSFFFHKKLNIGNLIDAREVVENPEHTSTANTSTKEVFDIQFFPESGNYFTGDIQLIAFKAIGTDGLAEEVSGTVYNQQDEEITSFASSHRGMGRFALTAQPGDRFYARVSSGSGLTKRIDLPAPAENGIGLHLSHNRGKINFRVINRTELPIDSLNLMIHLRGEVILISGLSSYTGQLPDRFLPAGVASFSIIDASARVWCERLFFSRNMDEAVVSMTADRPEYLQRSPVELSFTIQKQDSTPLPGSYSLSITDQFHVKKDSLNDDIRSYLLLSSDLKGYIEQPQEYLSDHSALTREKTDLLMMTQGWSRFATAAIARAEFPPQEYYMEIGQATSGKVHNLFNKPVKGNDVMLLSSYKQQIRFSKTDSLGQYYFDGIEFPDSTNLIVKAMSKTKLVDVEVIPDEEKFPASPTHLPVALFGRQPVNHNYLLVSREKYYTEGGMTVINLDEVTIDAEKPTDSTDSYYAGIADSKLDAKRLEDYQGMRVMDILSMLPGVEVDGEQVSIRGSGGNPLFVIDGIQTDHIEDIIYLNVTDVEEILLYKGASAAIFGSQGGNGAIAFTLKKGYEARSLAPPSLVYTAPLGFQKPTEFYVPRYEVDSILQQTKRDLRTTVYWNPELIPDSTGQVTVNFYTADNPNDYTVEVEGLGHNGTICRYRGSIKRK